MKKCQTLGIGFLVILLSKFMLQELSLGSYPVILLPMMLICHFTYCYLAQIMHQNLNIFGRGGGQGVSVLALYSNDASSIPSELFC